MRSAARIAAFALALSAAPCAAEAAQVLKIGFISTFSGPAAAISEELLAGFKLGIAENGGKLGRLPVELIVVDDQGKPDVGRQLAERLVESDRVDIVTGINFSNVLLAIAKPVLDSKTFLISINAAPSQLAGKGCNPYFFSVSWQNDNIPEAMGKYLSDKGVKGVYLMAPNYPAGRDMIAGFKRFYHGDIVGEVYPTWLQLDYAAEIAQMRSVNPPALFAFFPGGMGINFTKQFAQAGLAGTIPLYAPSFSIDQTVLPGIGDAALGIVSTTFWSEDLDNPANRRFVEAFEATEHRIPAPYAAQGYDGARLIAAALEAIGGRIDDRRAFREALENAPFQSVRGRFRFNANHFPIQDFYATEVAKDAQGRLVNKLIGTVFEEHADAYATECAMAKK
ncbi:amino acid/amide ABC transporter substrate-binding protein, HAAT family [Rhizobiales bacterium GAS191]|jgi:branched-chain amino acid transport system substrate-binding protein|nr:amino acid/amide ABC transporter substrate-binding protein, HAAT family [Rhizobiales bacterium GAS191]SEE50004.1 amino acid/amide ABC transporter substrate-binding protein, HAAT family [Rhizobiales bacterium GAS188]